MMVWPTRLALGCHRINDGTQRKDVNFCTGVRVLVQGVCPAAKWLSGDGRGRMGDHESAVSISTERSL
jgi:hypothetical protein